MPETDQQDKTVIASVLSGNNEAYAALVRRYQDRVFSLCLSLLHNPTEAEDAAQDVFVKAYHGLPSFRLESSFFTWLYRVAYRHCLDLMKSPKRSRTESWEGLRDRAGDGVEPTEPVREPHEVSVDQVQGVLSELSPEYRLVLTLREVEGLSYEEIAGATGVSLESVRARLRRAREALQIKTRHLFPQAQV